MAKSKWLQEVEDDADRITRKRIKDREEELAYLESKKADVPAVKEVPADAPVMDKKGAKK